VAVAKPTDVPAPAARRTRQASVEAAGHAPDPAANRPTRSARTDRPATTAQPSEEGVAVGRGAPGQSAYAARDRSGLLDNARLAWAAAVVSLALLLGLAFATVDARREAGALREQAETREEVREAAEVVALQVATFDGATIEEWLATTQSLATGDFQNDLGRLYTQEFRDGLRDNQVRSVGTLTDSFVQQIEGDRAEVFLLLGQVASNATTSVPIEDELRVEVELMRVDGRWLASDVAVLGPESLARQGGDAPEQGEEQGAQPAPAPAPEPAPEGEPAAPPPDPAAPAPQPPPGG